MKQFIQKIIDKRLFSVFLLLIGSLLLLMGILRKEHISVLQKAIFVCLECIGIG